jgi:hypothetical protein
MGFVCFDEHTDFAILLGKVVELEGLIRLLKSFAFGPCVVVYHTLIGNGGDVVGVRLL